MARTFAFAVKEADVTVRRVVLCVFACAAAIFDAQHFAPPQRVSPIDRAAAIRSLKAMPLAFEENRGQTDAAATFVARGQGYAMWATADGPVLRLSGRDQDHATTLRLRAVGGAQRTAVAEAPLAGRANYFKGSDPSRWVTNVPRHGALRYAEVYDGIDLVLHGTQQSLEYDFEVQPHADPAAIAVAFDGVEQIRIEDDGDLSIAASGGGLRFHRPVAYQVGANGREPVAARYELAANGEVRFAIGEYDRSRELVIDPVIDYSTYLGGTLRWNGVTTASPSSDDAYGLAVDAAGNAYLTGVTNAVDFPLAGVPFDTSCSGCFASGTDAFVAKIDPSQPGAASLVFTTYLGALGPAASGGNAIAVDANGAVHVTGWTSGYDQASTPGNDAFPVTASAVQPNDGGDLAMLDAFFSKLDPSGSSLLYSTYLGSNNVDEGYGVRVDGAGFTYVAGRTAGANFVPLKNGFQMIHGSPGLSDAFVVKIDTLAATAQSSLVYGSFYGGTGNDHVESLAIDEQGRAYIAGDSNSNGNTLATKNAFLPVATPGQHAFVAVLDTTVSGAGSLYYATYIGTSGTQGATFREGGIGVDANGIIFMTGSHFGGTFATTPGAFRSAIQNAEAFVIKIDPTQVGAATLVAATMLGGSFNETPYALTVDGGGNPIVTGATQSADFPVTECGLPKKNGQDVFVTALNKNLTGLLYSTILGGTGSEFGNAVALGPNAIYVAGGTDSLDFTTTPTAFDTTHNGPINGSGARDAFLTVIKSPYDRCPTPPSAVGSNETTTEDTPKTIVLKASDIGGQSTPPDDLTWTITQLPTKGTLDVTGGTMTHGSGTAYEVSVVYSPNPNTTGADTFKFQVNDGQLNSNIATVNITITAVNDAPIPDPQTVTTTEGQPKHITLTATDPENNVPLYFAIAQMPANGSLAGAENLWTYTPNAGFSGTDSFTFFATDSLNATSAPGVVTIDVVPLNKPPVLVGDAATTPEDVPVTVAVLANDSDPDNDVFHVMSSMCSILQPVVNADDTVTVTPPLNFNGVIECEYVVQDAAGFSASALFTVTVTPVNDSPDGIYDAVGTDEDTPLVIFALQNDIDPDGDALTIDSVTCNAGTPVLIAGNTQIQYTPAENYHGDDDCFYIVVDGHGGGDGVDIDIAISSLNDMPTAQDDVATTPEDEAVTIPVLFNDQDPDGDILGIDSLVCTNQVVPVENPDGSITLTPPLNFNGQMGCSYKAVDGNGGAAPAQVFITVTPVNDPPVGVDDDITVPEDSPIEVDFILNDTDVDGDTISGGGGGCSTMPYQFAGDNTIKIFPPPDYNGSFTCGYFNSDGQAIGGAQIHVTVTPVNDAPVVDNPGDRTTTEGVLTSLTLSGGDVDGDALIFNAVGLPPGLSISPEGTISGAAAGGSAGSYVVTVTADDGNGATGSATFTWTILAPPNPNQSPVCSAAVPSTPSLWGPDKALWPIDILGVIDPEGPVTITITAIFQDEPTNTEKDPAFAIDGAGVGTATAMVRAERLRAKDGGDGRIYDIRFAAVDAQGASCAGAVLVGVPENQKRAAVDSIVRYDSTVAGAPVAPQQKGKK